MRLLSLLFTSCLLLFCSCIPNQRIVYFSNPNFNGDTATPIYNQPQTYRLQPRDVLSVRIKTLDADTEDYFNIQSDGGIQQLNPAGLYLNGYSISNEGTINLPEVGEVVVANLTLSDAEQKISDAIKSYITNATISVKLVSFKITVLGEVNNPGYYYVYNEQATILEALGIAGDLTDFGNRENITLIRQTKTGSEGILLNLKDPDLLVSEYYYLQPNDALYVQPLEAKNTRDNLSVFTLLSIVFSAISSTAVIVSLSNN